MSDPPPHSAPVTRFSLSTRAKPLAAILTCLMFFPDRRDNDTGQGIFLSPLEEQSSLLFNFVFKMFSVGSASLPAGGMGEVPEQIAADLPEGTRQYDVQIGVTNAV